MVPFFVGFRAGSPFFEIKSKIRKSLFVFFQLENRFDRFPESACDFQGQHGGGNESPAFDGVHRLAAYADGVGQLLLGHAQFGPFDTDFILHFGSLFLIATAGSAR